MLKYGQAQFPSERTFLHRQPSETSSLSEASGDENRDDHDDRKMFIYKIDDRNQEEVKSND